jgi:NAD+ synthase (glutamine-hydrolysing)
MVLSKSFKIAIAQINPKVGDFENNVNKHIHYVLEAKKLGANVVVFSELSLVGYIPRDILFLPKFLSDQNSALEKLLEHSAGIHIICGAVTLNPSGIEKPFFNSALVLHDKKIVHQYDKKLLPTYGVFDERRYFERGTKDGIVTIDGVKIGLSICEDMWQKSKATGSACYSLDPFEALKKSSPDILINLSGSPYYQNKIATRVRIIEEHLEKFKCPMIYVNQVGSNDAIIFDGYSMIGYEKGKIDFLKGFLEDLKVVDFGVQNAVNYPDFSLDLEKALVLGIQDYVHKNGFKKVCLGLSGGIDSACVIGLCVKALGSQNVHAIYMPSKFSRSISETIAYDIAKSLNVKIDTVPIEPIVQQYVHALDSFLNIAHGGVTLENLQARIRGNIIMAYSNKNQTLMMGCSNKTELALGYGTIYGDIAGALLPIGDLYKHEVYKLAHQIGSGIYPEDVFTRPPSAELFLNQISTDTLPPFEVSDLVLKLFLENNLSFDEIKEKHPQTEPYIQQIKHLFLTAEFKRYQAPMVLKVSKNNFGTGWDMPIARA